MVATSHSPQLLGLLSPDSLARSSLTYRLPEQSETGVVPLLEVPTAREVLKKHSPIHLQESGWFEDAMGFAQPEEGESAPRRPRRKGPRQPLKGETAA